jgi:hypothetical protein
MSTAGGKECEMRDRTTFGQVVGLLLMVLAVSGMAALHGAATPPAGTSMLRPGEPGTAGLSGSDTDCTNLITPDKIGHEEFERYGIAEKLQSNEFVAQESGGYIVCSHGQPRHDEDWFQLFADMYYMFDREDGELVVTSLEWDDALREHESSPRPTQQLVEALPPDDSDTTTVCIDAKTPIIEIGDENPEQWNIWDILSSGPCAIEISSSVCWDCGEDLVWRWLIPVPTGQDAAAAPSGEPGGEMVCIDAGTAVQISGQQLEEDDTSRVASGQCDLQLGGEQVCWHCREERREPTPSPVPTERARKEPLCSDYLTPEVIGHEAWEKYGIADRLRSNEFQRHMCRGSDCIICYGHRMIDEVRVGSDELYYRFDFESGELLMERIHWREDLPEHLPEPLISQQEAEAMVEGEVRGSHLAIHSPDNMLFETDKSSIQDPCWFVSSTEKGQIDIPRVTVINAMTGEVLARYCPC